MIPQAAPRLGVQRYRQAVLGAIEKVLDTDHYILGPWVEDFERAFAGYCGVRHCVTVNSGTDALAIALRALGIGPGDEVITAAMTAPGTALAIRHCGAEPRFVDIEAATRCLDVGLVEAAVTAKTAAIVPVHFHGYPMEMTPLLKLADSLGLVVVEDCAHAHGARRDGRHVGSFGQAGAFSFFPTKNLGCIGDGGAIVTDDDRLAHDLRYLRSFETQGAFEKGSAAHGPAVGFNSRLDALQAAVLSALLPHLDQRNQQRREIATRYRRLLEGLDVGLPPEHPGAVYHQFALAVEDRDRLRRDLAEQGISTGMHYARPLHQDPAFVDCAGGPLPNTEALARRVVSLPIQPEVAQGRESLIAGAIREALKYCNSAMV